MSTRAPKIYTKTGDLGETSLIGGRRVPKSELRLEAFGTVDELNSTLGLVIADTKADLPQKEFDRLQRPLAVIQNDLFNLGSQLACEDPAIATKLPPINEIKVQRLEALIDELTEPLPPLKNFILPGGCRSAAGAHLARTVCRRAERLCVELSTRVPLDEIIIRFLNRLSDFLFTLARYLNHACGHPESEWSHAQD